MHTDQPACVTNADFAELSAHGRTMAPTPEDPALAEFGPLGSPAEDFVWAGSDPLEAFCDTWGANAPSPAVAPFPSR